MSESLPNCGRCGHPFDLHSMGHAPCYALCKDTCHEADITGRVHVKHREVHHEPTCCPCSCYETPYGDKSNRELQRLGIVTKGRPPQGAGEGQLRVPQPPACQTWQDVLEDVAPRTSSAPSGGCLHPEAEVVVIDAGETLIGWCHLCGSIRDNNGDHGAAAGAWRPPSGWVLPGWTCNECMIFNGATKELLAACRSCATPRRRTT